MHQDSFKSGPRAVFGALAFLLTVLLGASAPAEATEIVIGKMEKVGIKGDLRLRQENFHKRQGVDRSRQRFRLRLGTELPFSSKVKAKVRFASGTGEQTSTNQSFDNLSSQKSIWIDLASLEYKPVEALNLSGGRMANPLWTVYSSDIVWDGDFNPEGFGENLKLSLFGRGRFFLNALQGVADEDSGVNTDQWFVSSQAGIILPLFAGSRLTVAGARHEWVNETTTTRKNAGTFSQTHTQGGNRRFPSNVLLNEFRVMELTGEVVAGLFGLPLSLQGTYINNTKHRDASKFSDKTLADSGFQAGLILGKASGKGKWEIAFFRKQVAADATVADVADSDFGDGGTNRKGNIGWIAYCPEDYMVFQVKGFNTKVNDIKLNSNKQDDINRLQVDLSVKF